MPKSYRNIKVKAGTVTRPVEPNAGIKAKYDKKLQSLVDEMARSVLYFLGATYRAREGEIAMDASPAAAANARLRKLMKRWTKKFDASANEISRWFVGTTNAASTVALKQSLSSVIGGKVRIPNTRRLQSVITASVNENVSLIKSIPAEYFKQIEGALTQSIVAGNDLETLTQSIKSIGGKATERATLIARDQTNKVSAAVSRLRRLDMAITRAVWIHSGAGKHPRASHLAANGKEYDIEKGLLIDGEWLQPGEAINCRCTSAPIIPEFEANNDEQGDSESA